jgi:hypothetical protein
VRALGQGRGARAWARESGGSRVGGREGGVEVHGVRAEARGVKVRYPGQGRGHHGVSQGRQAEEQVCRRGRRGV